MFSKKKAREKIIQSFTDKYNDYISNVNKGKVSASYCLSNSLLPENCSRELNKFLVKYGACDIDPSNFGLRGKRAIETKIATGEDIGFQPDDTDFCVVYTASEPPTQEIMPRLMCYDNMFAGRDDVTEPLLPAGSALSCKGMFQGCKNLAEPSPLPHNVYDVRDMYKGSGIKTSPDLSGLPRLEISRMTGVCADCDSLESIAPLPDAVDNQQDIERLFGDKDISGFKTAPENKYPVFNGTVEDLYHKDYTSDDELARENELQDEISDTERTMSL